MARCSTCQCVQADCDDCLICADRHCCTAGHRHAVMRFFGHAKSMFAAALGIEILCIAFAELGQNTGFYIFGYSVSGAAISYAMGYGLAGFATFLNILGRSKGAMCEDSCCSILENVKRKGLLPNLYGTLYDFAAGAKRLASLHRQPDLKHILKSSLVILVTAESACILVAETVDLALYQYSILLSVPLSLLAGTFAIVAPLAYRKARS